MAGSKAYLSAGMALYWTLKACKAEGLDAPKGTGHIVCDDMLCVHLATDELALETNIDLEAVRGAYHGLPVKQVFVLVPYAQKIKGLMERDLYLRRRARKRAEGRAA